MFGKVGRSLGEGEKIMSHHPGGGVHLGIHGSMFGVYGGHRNTVWFGFHSQRKRNQEKRSLARDSSAIEAIKGDGGGGLPFTTFLGGVEWDSGNKKRMHLKQHPCD